MKPKFKALIDCDERGLVKIDVTKIDFQESCAYVYDPEVDHTYQIDYRQLYQSTGMVDKRGVEIYNGDMLKHPVQGYREVIYPMSENFGGFGLISEDGMKNTLQDTNKLYKVLGSIYVRYPEEELKDRT